MTAPAPPSDAELELLSDAVEHHHNVLIAYRDKNGSCTTREIRPQQLYGKWLDSWCHLRNAQRDFTIANIEAVCPRHSWLTRAEPSASGSTVSFTRDLPSQTR